MRILKGLGVAVGAGLLALAVFFLGACSFADGPIGIVAGGPFRSGEPHTGPEPDWSFAKDVSTVEFQLLDPRRSRTTWIVEVDGRAFVPSGYMTTWWGRIWKQWPTEAEQDGRALLRIDGTLYERQLERLRDGPMLDPVIAELARKYAPGLTRQRVDSGYLWIFERAPRGGG